jgi:hypothetical protein
MMMNTKANLCGCKTALFKYVMSHGATKCPYCEVKCRWKKQRREGWVGTRRRPRNASIAGAPREGCFNSLSTARIEAHHCFLTPKMAAMASAHHPDFRDNITLEEAVAVDNETRELLMRQHNGDAPGYLQLVQDRLSVRLQGYKLDTILMAGCHGMLPSGYLKTIDCRKRKQHRRKA